MELLTRLRVGTLCKMFCIRRGKSFNEASFSCGRVGHGPRGRHPESDHPTTHDLKLPRGITVDPILQGWLAMSAVD